MVGSDIVHNFLRHIRFAQRLVKVVQALMDKLMVDKVSDVVLHCF